MSNEATVTRETTLRGRDNCLCLYVQRAARALARRFDEAFRLLELTNGQFSLLMSLNRPDPPRIGTVAAFLSMDRTTLTAALSPLERRGLVRVIANPHGRRARLMVLTEEGRALLARAVPIWEETHAEVDRLVESPGPDVLRSALQSLSGIGAGPAPA